MHLKNFSLLREGNAAWHLADAYDLLPVKLLLPEDTEDMALTLNGKKAKIGKNDFMEFGKSIGLNERQIIRAISRIVDALAANIESVLAESLLTDEFADKFNKLVKRNVARICDLRG
jgi:serine/threonine-protein kinase HipA